jgi:predicted dehydrogenase
MGNGGNASDSARQAVEILRSGAIGQVKQVHAWSDRPGHWWTQAMDRPTDTPDVPATLDWDLWLGVAPKRPYHPQYVPMQWRGWYDFGTGAMGDMACHICNVAFWALELRDPAVIEAKTSPLFKESFPAWSVIRWEFPQSGRDKPLDFFWYDGGKLPDSALTQGKGLTDNGSIFVGDKGTLYCPSPNGSDPVLLPEKDFEGYKPPEPTIRRVDGKHHEEWIEAAKKGEPSQGMSSFPDRAAVMTESLLLGNLAVKTGKRIEWNAKEMRVTNDVPEAQAMVHPEYRTGR